MSGRKDKLQAGETGNGADGGVSGEPGRKEPSFEPGMDVHVEGPSEDQVPEHFARHRGDAIRAPRPIHLLWGFLTVAALLAGLWILIAAGQ